METRYILLENQWIEYQLIKEKRKSLAMKVEKGQLIVKAPYITSIDFIEESLVRYQKRLLKQIKSYEPYYDYQNHGYVDIFHQRYDIIVRDIQKRQCQIHDQSLYVYHHSIQQTVEMFLKQKLLNYIKERIIYYLAYEFDLDMPEIAIKKYKGRWGCCFYDNNKVIFNLSLVHLEKDLIDYVIVHELTHFLQANHSPRFYNEMAKRMPDYKQRQKRLKEKHV